MAEDCEGPAARLVGCSPEELPWLTEEKRAKARNPDRRVIETGERVELPEVRETGPDRRKPSEELPKSRPLQLVQLLFRGLGFPEDIRK